MVATFCICTNTHLPYAKVLGDSIVKYNINYQFFICLVDKIIPENVQPLGYSIIHVEELGIPEWNFLNENYTPFELCCALKPFFASFLINNFPLIKSLIYLDTDIYCYYSLSIVERQLQSSDILFTPHFTQDEQVSFDTELFLLQTGYFNAGFFALKNSPTSVTFLDWWKERLVNHGYDRGRFGMFVDQLWLNSAYYKFTQIDNCQLKGLNVAQWNIEYRLIKIENCSYYIKPAENLIFYHFSDYQFVAGKNNFLCDAKVRKYKVIYKMYEKYHLLISESKSRLITDAPCIYGSRNFFKKQPSYRKRKYKVLRYLGFLIRNI